MSFWNDVSMDVTCPERMKDIKYVPMDDILDVPVCVLDYELFQSKSDKYSDDKKTGVHIVLKNVETGQQFRICTHAGKIVGTFQKIHDAKTSIPANEITAFTVFQGKVGKAYVFSNKVNPVKKQ